jgi:hypothetical protein
VLQGKESRLKVLAVPQCGWTDLGTPKRIGLTLQRLREEEIGSAVHRHFPMQVNLAVQYARLINAAPLFCEFNGAQRVE